MRFDAIPPPQRSVVIIKHGGLTGWIRRFRELGYERIVVIIPIREPNHHAAEYRRPRCGARHRPDHPAHPGPELRYSFLWLPSGVVSDACIGNRGSKRDERATDVFGSGRRQKRVRQHLAESVARCPQAQFAGQRVQSHQPCYDH